MDLLQAVVLGIVQGLTEFIPVSSSGHLILVPALFGWDDRGIAFDVGLHTGTLLAVLGYFWRDWWQMARSALADLPVHRANVAGYSEKTRLLLFIVLGSIPIALAGLFGESLIEDHVREPWIVAIALMAAGAALFAAERYGSQERTTSGLTAKDAVLIGLAQAAALVPGVSRSGATISAGMGRGLVREDAARFAFLLGTPAFVGATLLTVGDFAGESSSEIGEMVAGFVASAIVGFAAIGFLMRFVRTHTLIPFVVYRYGVAIATLVIAAVRVA